MICGRYNNVSVYKDQRRQCTEVTYASDIFISFLESECSKELWVRKCNGGGMERHYIGGRTKRKVRHRRRALLPRCQRKLPCWRYAFPENTLRMSRTGQMIVQLWRSRSSQVISTTPPDLGHVTARTSYIGMCISIILQHWMENIRTWHARMIMNGDYISNHMSSLHNRIQLGSLGGPVLLLFSCCMVCRKEKFRYHPSDLLCLSLTTSV